MSRKSIPAAVAREIRQRQGFGCQKCGCPVLEYHHIKEWSEEQHYDPDWMMGLCPNCHSEVGKWDQDSQLALKNSDPKNIVEGLPNGLLQAANRNMDFVIGSNRYIETPTILEVAGEELIGFRRGEYDRIGLNFQLYDPFGNRVLTVNDGSIELRSDLAWDFIFRSNYLKLLSEPRNIIAEIDFRQQPGTINAKLHSPAGRVSLSPTETRLGDRDWFIKGSTFQNVMVGISLN